MVKVFVIIVPFKINKLNVEPNSNSVACDKILNMVAKLL